MKKTHLVILSIALMLVQSCMEQPQKDSPKVTLSSLLREMVSRDVIAKLPKTVSKTTVHL